MDVAIDIFPAQRGILVLRHAPQTTPNRWIRVEGKAHRSSSEVVDATLRTGLFTGAGESRLGWAHATFADFLAAQWMLTASLDDQQIESLLFAEDGHLYPRVRQVAAWLLAVAPDRFREFIARDPQSFLQSADIPNESLRAEVVDALFAATRAGTFYDEFNVDLTGLVHGGLATQIRGALTDPVDDVKRLALRITRQSLLSELAPEMTALALDPAAEVSLRVAAALNLHDLSAENPTGALVGLLKPSGSALDNPSVNHELEGAALMASWPHAITTAEVLAMLGPRHPRNYFGLYSTFVSQFAAQLSDADLIPACEWILSSATWLNDSRFSGLVDAVTRLCIGHLDKSVARRALCRVAFQRADEYEPLFSEDVFEIAPELSAGERRAVSLVLLAEATQQQTWEICDGLGSHGLRLLTSADLPWLIGAYRETDDGRLRVNVATALNQLYRPELVAHSDVVLGLPGSDPAAEVFSFWRGVMLLDSPEVAEAREQWALIADRRKARADRTAATGNDAWVNPEIAALAKRARSGDADAYWQAVRLVTVRPGTQRHMDQFQPDLTLHPRWESLSTSTRQDLVAASDRYVRKARCEPDSWLGSDTLHHPARAGYQALMLLLRENPAALSALPPTVWREWAPIIVDWTVMVKGATADDKTALIAMAAEHARPRLVSALLVLLDRAVRDGQHVLHSTELAALMSDEVASELVARLGGAHARESRDGLFRALIAGGQVTAVEPVLLSWINDSERATEPDRAAEAAMALLLNAAKVGWPYLRQLFDTDPEFMKKVFLTEHLTYDRRIPDLDDDDLALLYLRLRELFPPAEDPQFEDAHIVGPRESVARWREAVLERLQHRGTASAVRAIEGLCEALPDESWLLRILIDARRIRREQSWEPLRPQDLDRLAASHSARLVRTDADLHHVALLALGGIQDRLQGDTPSAQFLWDTHAGRPKTEEEISDYLAIELNNRLGSAGTVVTREVQVRRIRPSGLPERTDIRLEAVPIDPASPGTRTIKIPGEVKGAWNAGVIDSVSTQLVERYMADFGTEYGIYVVVWFDQESWTDVTDRRRAAAARFADIAQLRERMIEAAAAAGPGVAVVVLNASLRRPT